MNKELKKEQIEILKTKYGIDIESDKKWWHCIHSTPLIIIMFWYIIHYNKD